jgi:hypothetical protein
MDQIDAVSEIDVMLATLAFLLTREVMPVRI